LEATPKNYTLEGEQKRIMPAPPEKRDLLKGERESLGKSQRNGVWGAVLGDYLVEKVIIR